LVAKLLQFAGSLAAILMLAAIAWKLRLGGDARLHDSDQARALAEDALCGFDAAEIAIDRAGMAALLRDSAGRVMLIRRHGAHWAARLLDGSAHARLDRNLLTVASGETRFGSVTLDLGDEGQVWAASLRRPGAA
jgi:hypothetical protein